VLDTRNLVLEARHTPALLPKTDRQLNNLKRLNQELERQIEEHQYD
jgi:hypothetical protein